MHLNGSSSGLYKVVDYSGSISWAFPFLLDILFSGPWTFDEWRTPSLSLSSYLPRFQLCPFPQDLGFTKGFTVSSTAVGVPAFPELKTKATKSMESLASSVMPRGLGKFKLEIQTFKDFVGQILTQERQEMGKSPQINLSFSPLPNVLCILPKTSHMTKQLTVFFRRLWMAL